MTILDLSGMRAYLDGDKEEEREIVGVFLTKSKKDLNAIKSSIEVQSLEDWKESCHSLKGSAALLGAFILRDLCQGGEMITKFDATELRQKLDEIHAAYNDVITALDQEGLI